MKYSFRREYDIILHNDTSSIRLPYYRATCDVHAHYPNEETRAVYI